MTEKLLETVTQAGALGAISFYVLYQLGRKIDRLTDAMIEVQKSLSALIARTFKG